MAIYHLYYVGPTGRFAARESIEAPDDDTAITLAVRRRDDRGLELWQGPRRVRVLTPGKRS